MLCSHVFQPSFGPLMEFHWPIRSIWPHMGPLALQRDMLLKSMQDMSTSMGLLEKVHEQILQEMDKVPCSLSTKPLSCQMEKDGDNFALTLDTKDFSPEELSIKQVDRKLMVSGKTEKKQDDGKGSYSYRCQEFRQVVQLPEDVNPTAVTCSLSDGQLQIRAPRLALPEVSERTLPINSTPAVMTSASQSEANSPNEARVD
ncbi:heat shock protein beta-11-like [Brienomyrus brachyistius]|uniref:heat shock protein beta-11-like n=1 Tax=Brienomyrus brachyistius TaxID=42636 RepID=UPI0020B3C580|nr:heat shock protein beta-11-like [Brienomyrus brachyistius]